MKSGGSNDVIEGKCLPKGTKLKDRYIVEELLGAGGFGITYEAYDTLLNRMVAIKEFFVDGSMTRDIQQSNIVRTVEDEASRTKVEKSLVNFRYEIKAMKALQNVPYISRIRDDFSENNTEYIVKELLKGRTLSEYKNKNGIKNELIKNSVLKSNTELMESLEHVLIALEELHALGFIHRDISPGNLFLTEDGDLYLIDFGTATSTDMKSEYRNEQVFEHKGFHAPEHNDVSRQGAWTDIYSLCATIVYLLTGEAVPEAAQRQVNDEVPGMLVKCRLSAVQQNALIKGLNTDIARRTSSARELRIGLCGALSEQLSGYKVKYCASTDIGSRRVNQDNLLVDGLFMYEGRDLMKEGEISCNSTELHMMAVCDGVGGASSGELASRAVVQALNHFMEQYRNSDVLPERLTDELLDQVNEKIVTLGKKIGKTGTTMSFVIWKGNQYYAINIGDSPIFLLRKFKLTQLSTAHTLAAAKMMAGLEVTLRDNHTLMNYVGKEHMAGSGMASVRHGYIHKGDTFFLCSDGVTDKIDRDRLKRYLSMSATGSIKSLRRTLSRYSNNDNCTAIIIKF